MPVSPARPTYEHSLPPSQEAAEAGDLPPTQSKAAAIEALRGFAK